MPVDDRPEKPARGRRRTPQLRVAESVAADLRSRILAGDLDGEKFPTQDQLVHEFGVSYPSVREAIRILETEGLITVRRGNVGGAEVHRPNEASAAYHLGLALQSDRVTLSDLAESLQQLEPLCAAECARREDRMEEVVPALRANIKACEAVMGDGVAFTHEARRFHDLLVAFTPTATLRYIVRSLVMLWSAQEEAWAEVMASRGDYPEHAEAAEVLRAHRRIVTEIAAGRPIPAGRATRAHSAATQSLLLDRFGDGIVNAAFAKHRDGSAGRDRGPL